MTKFLLALPIVVISLALAHRPAAAGGVGTSADFQGPTGLQLYSLRDMQSVKGAAAVLEFENGALGVLESSVVATGHKNYLSWEVNGSKGSLKWDMEHPNSLFACLEGQDGAKLLGFSEISVTEQEHPYVGHWWPHGHNLGWEHSHIIEKFHFLDAVAHGRPLSPYNATFEDGYRAAVIIAAMRQSSASGKRIEPSY